MRKLWVVEIWNDEYSRRSGQWEPTVGARLTKGDAREELKTWRASNPSDKFRVRPYVAEGRP